MQKNQPQQHQPTPNGFRVVNKVFVLFLFRVWGASTLSKMAIKLSDNEDEMAQWTDYHPLLQANDEQDIKNG